MTTGPSVAKARSSTCSTSAGSWIVKPRPPIASAALAKSIGWSSQPNCGLPRNSICSQAIWFSMLFLMTRTFSGMR